MGEAEARASCLNRKALAAFCIPSWQWEDGDIVMVTAKYTNREYPSIVTVELSKGCGCGGVRHTEFYGTEAEALWKRFWEGQS